MNNILDFGAVGDGKTVNTKAIQAAIDAGGTVYIPQGVFVTGTIYLKSNGGLHLAPGAILQASHNSDDYNAPDAFFQNHVWPNEGMNGQHLILALEQENVFIEGKGIIDGQSKYWINDRKWCGTMYDIQVEHPGQMIFFCECKGVSVTEATLISSPFWHLFLLGCQDAVIHGVKIKGEPLQAVNDGIDIDCCERVTVSDCIIDVGDDALTIRCCEHFLKEKRASENITVTNCVLSSSLDNGIRVGVGPGHIKNVFFSNIIIHHTLQGITVNGRFTPRPGFNSATIENIYFDNIIIDAKHPLMVMLSNLPEHPPLEGAYIKNIAFSKIHSTSTRDVAVLGHNGGEVSGISFTDCDFLFTGKGKNDSYYTSDGGKWVFPSSDYGFRLEKVKSISLRNVKFSYNHPEKAWKGDIKITASENVTVTDCVHPLGVKED